MRPPTNFNKINWETRMLVFRKPDSQRLKQCCNAFYNIFVVKNVKNDSLITIQNDCLPTRFQKKFVTTSKDYCGPMNQFVDVFSES